jgi:hypothetical protein
MRKSLCVFVVGSLFFLAGCGDDDPTPVQCLVTKITNVLALDGTGSLEFTYANNQLTTITLKTDEDGVIETIPLSVTYTGNNITRLTAQRDLIVITFTYDGSNRITSLLESIDDVEFKNILTIRMVSCLEATFFSKTDPHLFLTITALSHTPTQLQKIPPLV